MRLFLLKVIYIGSIFTSNQLEKVIKRNSNYVFYIYDTINKEFSKIYYSKEINQFVVEIDNVIVNKTFIYLGCKLEIINVWNLEN